MGEIQRGLGASSDCNKSLTLNEEDSREKRLVGVSQTTKQKKVCQGHQGLKN